VGFRVTLYNEKVYVIKSLYEALKQREYKMHLYTTPKGRTTNYGSLGNDYHYIVVYAKDHIKRLLWNVEATLPHKRLKARLIKYALRKPSRPVYWSTVEPIYGKIEAVYGEMLEESKLIVKSLHKT